MYDYIFDVILIVPDIKKTPRQVGVFLVLLFT